MHDFLPKLLAATFAFSTLVAEPSPIPRFLKVPVSVPSQPNAPTRCVIPVGPLVPVSALAFSPDGKILAVGGYKEVILWDMVNSRLLKRIGQGHVRETVRALAFTAEGRLLAVGDGEPGRSGGVRIFKADTGEFIAQLDGPKDVLDTAVWSPDGKLLVAGGFDSKVYVWDAETRKPLTTLDAHGGQVTSAAFSADGAWLATAGADATTLLWEVKTWKTVSRMPQDGPVNAAAFAPNGQNIALAVSGKTGRGIRLRNMEYPEPEEAAGQPKQDEIDKATTKTDKPAPKKTAPALNRLMEVGSGNPMTVLWDRQGSRLFVPCSDKTIRVFGFPNGGTLATLRGHDDWVYCVALSPDESLLASGAGDGAVKLWSTVENRLLATLIQKTPLTDQWIIVTPKGTFATSSPDAIQWQTSEGTPADTELVKTLQNPEAFRQAMKAPKPPVPTPSPEPATPTASPTPAAPAASPKQPAPTASPKPIAPPSTPTPVNPAASPKA